MTGAICDGGLAYLRRRVQLCPTEGRRRRMITRSQAWYGTEWRCTGCGDRWLDGELGPRPFERGWRARAIADARRLYQATPTRTPAEHRAAFSAWLKETK